MKSEEDMYKVRLSYTAKSDIKDCYDYIYDVLKNEMSAESLLGKIEDSFKELDVDPGHYPKINDEFLGLLEIKYIKIDNYLCFFKIDDTARVVNVIRFIYAKRDWKEIQGELV